MKIIASNKWKYNIDIKNKFEDNATQEVIAEIYDSLHIQLEALRDKVEKSNLIESEKDSLDSEIMDISDNFSFLRDLSNGNIPEDEWDDYNFDGEFKEWVDMYLDQLYDLGDRRVMNTNNVQEKFLFVN